MSVNFRRAWLCRAPAALPWTQQPTPGMRIPSFSLTRDLISEPLTGMVKPAPCSRHGSFHSDN